MFGYCPSDTELATTLQVDYGALTMVLDDVSGELTSWLSQEYTPEATNAQAITCTVVPTGSRAMALAFPDPLDLERYVPDELREALDVEAMPFRDLLKLLLARPSLDLVILRPQEGESIGPDPTLYVGVQIERARLLASIIQRALLETTGIGLLFAAFLKWQNETAPDAERLLVSAVLAQVALEDRLIDLRELAIRCGLDEARVHQLSMESTNLFARWWNLGGHAEG